jgi:HD-GYP domain-containing protein (c-di-GMP phosphodiesterase class II)
LPATKKKTKKRPKVSSASLAKLAREEQLLKEQINETTISIKRRVRERAVFQKINEAILRGKSFKVIIRQLIRAVQGSGLVKRVGIFAYDRHAKSLYGISGVDAKGRYEDISEQVYKLGNVLGPMSQAIRRKSGVFFTLDIWHDKNLNPGALLGIHKRVRGYAAFALRMYGRPVGVMTVDDLGMKRSLTRRDIDTLKIIADQAAVVLENALMIDAARQRVKTLIGLTDFSSQLIAVQRESNLHRAVARMTRRVFGARASALMLLDESGKHLRFAEVDGIARSHLKDVRIPLSAKVAPARVVARNKAEMANTIEIPDSPLLKKINRLSGFKLRNYVAAPMVLHGKPLGALLVINRLENLDFRQSDLELMTVLANQAATAIDNATIYEDTRGLYLDIVQSMVKAIEAKDPYTYGHSERVTKFSLSIGRSLGLSPGELEELRLSALLHDIGKIGIDDRLLSKTGRLNQQEWKAMRNHPQLGHDILQGIGLMKRILPGISHHHEHFTGGGYPNRLRGENIPLFGRIIAVADAYDAMTSDRAYRKKMSRLDARQELASCAGKQFDGHIVQAFMNALESGVVH